MSKKLLFNRVAYWREYLVMFPRDTEDSQVESTRDLLSRKNLLTLSQRAQESLRRIKRLFVIT